MDDDEFGFQLEPEKVLFIVREEGIKALWRHCIGPAVQGLVEGLSDFKKVVATGDDLPSDGEP